jgi:hypothetical protein
VRLDNGIHRLREVEPAAGLGEQVDIGGHPVQEAVSLDRVAAGQGKAVGSGRVERNVSEPLVKGVHGSEAAAAKRRASGRETDLPMSGARVRAGTAGSRPGGEPAR